MGVEVVRWGARKQANPPDSLVARGRLPTLRDHYDAVGLDGEKWSRSNGFVREAEEVTEAGVWVLAVRAAIPNCLRHCAPAGPAPCAAHRRC